MPLPYSAHARQQQRLLSPTDLWVVLLEVIHTALAQPVRMVVDTQELVSNGNRYMPIGASLELPQDQEGSYPSARITIDNVGRSLMRIVEDTHGLRGAKVRIMQVYRSRPNVIEQEYLMDTKDITVDQQSFSTALSYDDVLDRPSTPLTYRPTTKPGMF
jgi:hypothetical protein